MAPGRRERHAPSTAHRRPTGDMRHQWRITTCRKDQDMDRRRSIYPAFLIDNEALCS